MKVTTEVKERILALDRRYRSTWDAHAIAHIVGLSHTTVAKVLREFRGPRPKRAKQPHTRRTKFFRRDVMWSSDFVRVGWGWLLLVTMDEHSGYILGWDLVRSEQAMAVVEHAESILARMGRAPLVWKYDHGSAFTSGVFQGLLEDYKIVPYPIPPRSPWVNGRKERDNQEVHNWLIPLEGLKISRDQLDREIDEGMLVRNFVKPRSCLGFRKSAEVYFSEDAVLDADDEVREWFAQSLCDAKCELDVQNPDEVYEIKKSGERLHRKAVRLALQKEGLYEEWDVAAQEGLEERPLEAESVNKTADENVSF
jgi:transposase InsO family protein